MADEDYLGFGMTGEIAAIVAEEALDYLDSRRRSSAWVCPNVPIPYSRPLEQFAIPSVEAIAAAARKLTG